MKKILKIALLIILAMTMVVALTACGKEETESSKDKKDSKEDKKTESVVENKDVVVATKMDEEEWTDGKMIQYEEKIEASFKNDKLDTVKMTATFEDEDIAKEYIEAYNAMLEMMKEYSEEEEINFPEFKLSGKSASMELTAEEFAELESEDAEMTKAEFIEALEEEGYEVK